MRAAVHPTTSKFAPGMKAVLESARSGCECTLRARNRYTERSDSLLSGDVVRCRLSKLQ